MYKSKITVGKVRGRKALAVGEEANTDVRTLCAKYKYASQGNLILVREKSGNCQGNLLCSNCGHPEFPLPHDLRLSSLCKPRDAKW